MADPKNTELGADLPTGVTYTNPRRALPQNSITLRHHRLAREASRRHAPPFIPKAHSSAVGQMKPPRRNSSQESNDTGWSDPRQWFDQSNRNTKSTLNTSAMDVDPPFYQKATDSSNEETHLIPSQSPAYRHAQSRGPSFRPSLANSSSADDFRSVIDDLTIENKRLREELRRVKQMGPNSLRNDKLFEVKVHGLPSTRKRELEATLRDFTTKLERSSTGVSTGRKKTSGKSKEGASSISKHASSTSGSNSRPIDSAYASMGTGSSSNQPPGNARAARIRSNQNIENYLRDIPEGLWPRPSRMTEHEKKKLVVKRLEHLFTGKMGHPGGQPASANQPAPIIEDIEMGDTAAKPVPVREGAREAAIKSGDRRQQTSHSQTTASNTYTQSQSHSNSRSNAGQSNSRDNDKGSGSSSGHGSGSGGRSSKEGKNTSPQEIQSAEQRPTRPRDLDPDRRQVPADNMEYIRHLGIVAPEPQLHYSSRDVSPDAEGWVYLNLLGNLAQLHILNVTPDFIRSAVLEKSTKFQLSPDGRKIRWRGGDEGTRFTSDSGSKSQTDDWSSDDTDGSNERHQRKKPKGSKFNPGAQGSNSSESFHYKPLFVHHAIASSPDQEADASGSSNEQSEDSNSGRRSKWDQSRVSTGESQRKRRRDGAIIYYSGAPFCTDLSGDYGEVSPNTYGMTSSGDQPMQEDPVHLHLVHRSSTKWSSSGDPRDPLPFTSLSQPKSNPSMVDQGSLGEAEPAPSEGGNYVKADFPWSDSDQQAPLINLEASGLGGVSPDDHFVVIVSTKRPKQTSFDAGDDDGETVSDDDDDDDGLRASQQRRVGRFKRSASGSQEAADLIASQLALMSTESYVPGYAPPPKESSITIEYIAGKVRRLPPVPLPPPAFYFPSGDSDSDSGASRDEDISVSSGRSILSKRPMLEGSPDTDNRDLSGNDEEDEHTDGGPGFGHSARLYSRGIGAVSAMRHADRAAMPPLSKNTTGSSVATAGVAASGSYSPLEDA
ncbi:frequency clock protein [Xylaria palmicola]|nr:frequency clock protein [Xylaria palmicola]